LSVACIVILWLSASGFPHEKWLDANEHKTKAFWFFILKSTPTPWHLHFCIHVYVCICWCTHIAWYACTRKCIYMWETIFVFSFIMQVMWSSSRISFFLLKSKLWQPIQI
jgi:hypothetical protein